MNRRAARVTALVALLLLTVSAASRADPTKDETKKICADGYSQAQTLRDAHKLKDARTQLRICAQSSCPAFIVKDCTEWLVDLERRMPSVVLAARDERGRPLSNVAVSVDGTRVVERLDGESIEVDPGVHTFAFVTGDGARAAVPFTVLEGQKTQAVVVTIATGTLVEPPRPPAPELTPPGPTLSPTLSPTPSPTPSPTTAAEPTFWTTQRTLGAILGGAGVAGLATGGVFGLLAISAESSQKTDCLSTSSCPDRSKASSDHASAVSSGAVSTVATIAGGALLVGGAILYLTSPSSRETQVGLTVAPSSSHGGGLVLAGVF